MSKLNRMKFAIAKHEHISTICELVNNAYRFSCEAGWTSEHDIVTGERISAQHVENLIQQDQAFFIIGLHDEDGIGATATIQACLHLARQNDRVEISTFAVRPALQNLGIGTQLLQYAEQFALENFDHIAEFSLRVISQRSELVAFYHRRHYRSLGDVAPYPLESGFGLPLVDNLSIETLIKPAGKLHAARQ